jgi:hypothetical protein
MRRDANGENLLARTVHEVEIGRVVVDDGLHNRILRQPVDLMRDFVLESERGGRSDVVFHDLDRVLL